MHAPHADPVADGPPQGRAAPTGQPPAAPLAPETRRLTLSDWRALTAWCDGAGRTKSTGGVINPEGAAWQLH